MRTISRAVDDHKSVDIPDTEQQLQQEPEFQEKAADPDDGKSATSKGKKPPKKGQTKPLAKGKIIKAAERWSPCGICFKKPEAC